MINEKYKYSELTSKIIGCAMEVHKILGNGFQPGRRAEIIYQRALAIEFDKAGINYAREFEMTILYKGEDIGTRRVDFLVEDKVMPGRRAVEIKAIIALEAAATADVHLAQAINYLEAYDLEVGLLINRGGGPLWIKVIDIQTSDETY